MVATLTRLILHRTALLLLLSLLALSTTASCSQLNPLGFLSSGGPNVAANVQAGETNNQTVGTSKSTVQEIKVEKLEGTVSQTADSNKVNTDTVENLTINEIPVWVILLLILGWLLPTPTQIANGFLRLLRIKV